jgi:hypothetical protein
VTKSVEERVDEMEKLLHGKDGVVATIEVIKHRLATIEWLLKLLVGMSVVAIGGAVLNLVLKR